MPLAPVVIEIAPPESPADLRRSLVEACSRAVHDTECVEGSARPNDTGAAEEASPAVVAIVSWKDSANVRVEVALRAPQQWVTRDIVFDDHDPPEERWKTVGLVIGTLASVMTRHEEVPPSLGVPGAPAPAVNPAPSPESSNPAAPVPKKTTVPEVPRTPVLTARVNPNPKMNRPTEDVGIEAAGIVGSALDRGPVRAGARMGGRLRIVGALYATLGVSYSESVQRLSGVETGWAEGTVGLAFRWRLGGAFAALVHAEAFGERFATSIDTASQRGPQSGTRWIGGGLVGADVLARVTDSFEVFAGGAGRFTAGPTEVQITGNAVGTAPVVGWVADAGVSYGFR